jgi:hypothetical protein
MRRPVALPFLLAALALAGCGELRHRTFRYGEAAPVRPFAITLRDAEVAPRDGRILLRVRIEVANRSVEPATLSRERFVLRVGRDTDLPRDRNLAERVGFDTARFAPGESATLVLPFTLTRDSLRLPLRLIVDRRSSSSRDGREALTFLEVKRAGAPASLPPEGGSRRVASSRW